MSNDYKICGDFITDVLRSIRVMKKLFALLGAILSVIYLISPVDLISEIPLGPIGLIDDAAVIPIHLACLKVLGFDASRLLGRRSSKIKKAAKEDDIVDIS